MNWINIFDHFIVGFVVALITAYLDYKWKWGFFKERPRKSLQSPNWDSIFSLEEQIQNAMFGYEMNGKIWLVKECHAIELDKRVNLNKGGHRLVESLEKPMNGIYFKGVGIDHDNVGLTEDCVFSTDVPTMLSDIIVRFDVRNMVQEYYDQVFKSE